ncbi:MAG TPA: 3-oxoacyl-ACP reductase family protein [Thermomicrobiales bacterium]|nr:3-oxoacyl-ACP reductase family protein [Thermomicrobiales bacterium]
MTMQAEEARAAGAALTGRVAIVTGASRGIGAAIARELAGHGAHVVINYARSAGPAEQLAAELRGRDGGEVLTVQADVSDEEQARQLVERTWQRFDRLDMLVNNAAITRDKTVRKMSSDDWRAVIDTNLNSVFYCVHAAQEHLIAQGRGHIINISSIVALSGNIGQTNYTAAKGGLISFTKSLALEWARYGIRVNCVAPGFIDTDMLAAVPENIRQQIIARIPLRRFGAAEDVARAVRFLCVDGDYITGQTLSVNGGLYM